MANVQEVIVYNQPTGIGQSRLVAIAVMVTAPATGEIGGIAMRYVAQLDATEASRVEMTREDFLALRLLRAMP